MEGELRSAKVNERAPLMQPLKLAEYDPTWPAVFIKEAEQLASALGDRALRIEHVGSTSVQGLAAKPIIDIVLVVADSADEPAFVPNLENAGYLLRFREPEWHEHRMLKKASPDVNLHVFSRGCTEVDRMLLFRDWLRHDETDRRLYEAVKLDLIGRDWKFTQDYADAKSEVVEAIMARARQWAESGAPEAPA